MKEITKAIQNLQRSMFAEMAAQGQVNESDVRKGQFKAEATLLGRIEVSQTNEGVFPGEASRLGRIGV